jgi:hypothetical protein
VGVNDVVFWQGSESFPFKTFLSQVDNPAQFDLVQLQNSEPSRDTVIVDAVIVKHAAVLEIG